MAHAWKACELLLTRVQIPPPPHFIFPIPHDKISSLISWLGSSVVEHRIHIPAVVGSIPTPATNISSLNNAMNDRPIGIFDSGVGGLSILLEIKKTLPNENFIFLADQKFVPYGQKTKKELIGRVSKILDFFEKKNVKTVVIACNTATVYTISEMRERFKFPIIGTVPVVKKAAMLTKTGKVAVFSTPATAKSEYLNSLISQFASKITVLKIGGSNLEELVEKGNLNNPKVDKVLKNLLSPLVNDGVDVLTLGCTHYPFLRKKIQRIVGRDIVVIDSGGAVARRLKEVLTNNKSLGSKKSIEEHFTTGDKDKFKKVAEELMKEKVNKVENITL